LSLKYLLKNKLIISDCKSLIKTFLVWLYAFVSNLRILFSFGNGYEGSSSWINSRNPLSPWMLSGYWSLLICQQTFGQNVLFHINDHWSAKQWYDHQYMVALEFIKTHKKLSEIFFTPKWWSYPEMIGFLAIISQIENLGVIFSIFMD